MFWNWHHVHVLICQLNLIKQGKCQKLFAESFLKEITPRSRRRTRTKSPTNILNKFYKVSELGVSQQVLDTILFWPAHDFGLGFVLWATGIICLAGLLAEWRADDPWDGDNQVISLFCNRNYFDFTQVLFGLNLSWTQSCKIIFNNILYNSAAPSC